MDREGEKLLEEIKAKRGFVLDFHGLLAEEDHAFLRQYEDMISAAYSDDRTLDKKKK
jgi:4-carboxymuconolactone decarboxylase